MVNYQPVLNAQPVLSCHSVSCPFPKFNTGLTVDCAKKFYFALVIRLRALFEKTFFELNARNRMNVLANVKREREHSLQSASSFVVLRIGAITK